MFDRIPKGFALPAAALAGGVLFASVPLTPAMGLIGVPEVSPDTAQADAVVAEPGPDYRSPVTVMTAAQQERAVLAAQQARQQALEMQAAQEQAALLAQGGTTTGTTPFATGGLPVGTGGVATTTVTAKTREIQKLVRKYFPSDQLGNAMAISACESVHRDVEGTENSDGTTDWGVFQLNDGGTLQGALDAIGVSYSSTTEAQKLALETDINVKAAASLYREQGWAPWVCAYKLGIVASLYSNTPGPMDGKFDQWGKPTVSIPVAPTTPSTPTTPVPVPDPTDEPEPTPDPKPDPKPKPKPKPKPTNTPDPKPEPTRTPSPNPPSDKPSTPAPAPTTNQPEPPPAPEPEAPSAPSDQQSPAQPDAGSSSSPN